MPVAAPCERRRRAVDFQKCSKSTPAHSMVPTRRVNRPGGPRGYVRSGGPDRRSAGAWIALESGARPCDTSGAASSPDMPPPPEKEDCHVPLDHHCSARDLPLCYTPRRRGDGRLGGRDVREEGAFRRLGREEGRGQRTGRRARVGRAAPHRRARRVRQGRGFERVEGERALSDGRMGPHRVQGRPRGQRRLEHVRRPRRRADATHDARPGAAEPAGLRQGHLSGVEGALPRRLF